MPMRHSITHILNDRDSRCDVSNAAPVTINVVNPKRCPSGESNEGKRYLVHEAKGSDASLWACIKTMVQKC